MTPALILITIIILLFACTTVAFVIGHAMGVEAERTMQAFQQQRYRRRRSS